MLPPPHRCYSHAVIRGPRVFVATALLALCTVGTLPACADDSAGDGDGESGEVGEAGEAGESGPGPCVSNADCTGAGEVCLSDGTCADAYNRTYEFFVNMASVDATKMNGDNWDPLGDSPDPYFTVTVDGTEVFESSEFENNLGATWTQGVDVLVTPTTRVEITLWDRDLADHDLIETMIWDPVPQALLVSGNFDADGSNATWGASIELQD